MIIETGGNHVAIEIEKKKLGENKYFLQKRGRYVRYI